MRRLGRLRWVDERFFAWVAVSVSGSHASGGWDLELFVGRGGAICNGRDSGAATIPDFASGTLSITTTWLANHGYGAWKPLHGEGSWNGFGRSNNK